MSRRRDIRADQEQRIVLHVVSPQPPGSVGGAERHALDLAEEQLREGTFHPLVLAPGNGEYRSLVSARGIGLIEPEASWSLPALLRLRGELSRRGVRLVHAHGYKADVAGVLLTPGRVGWRPVPLVITSHGLVRTGIVLRAKTWLDVQTFSRADRMIATSRLEAETLSSGAARFVDYIANGVSLPFNIVRTETERARIRGSLALPPEGRLITFVGRLAPEKRADRFLDACALIATRVENACFLLVGDGPERAKLEKRAARLGLGGRLRLLGARTDVTDLLATSDLLLSTSDSEGTPRAVIEAMASGAVVVATSVGGLPDLVASGVDGVLVASLSAAALAEAAVGLLGDEPRMAALRSHARERARAEFSVERMARRVIQVYGEVIGQQATPR